MSQLLLSTSNLLPASGTVPSNDSSTPCDPQRSEDEVRVHILPVSPSKERVPVAAYCRVSTDDPSQEDSLEVQAAHWAQVIAEHDNWTLAGVYAEKESGTHAETREALMRLISDCTEGKVRIILTKSVSRFSRNTVDCLQLVRTLKALGVSVVFEKEHIDTGSMSSELFLSILAAFAAEESRSISQNVKLGYKHRFQIGEYHYKRPPYGYSVDNEGQLIVDVEEAAVVEEIFEAVLKGMKPTEIATQLIRRGISTKYNAVWTANTVTAIISNITYTGDTLLQKTYKDEEYNQKLNHGQFDQYYVPDHHEGIVSHEVFILANEKLGFKNPYLRITQAPVPEEDTSAAESDTAGDQDAGRRVKVIKADSKDTPKKRSSLRVAAYCRVSTEMEEQESSYEVQCSHYHDLIVNHVGWTLAGIFADEGISGTSLKHRDGFNRMIEDAEEGKIDLILTKSISRFARNTLDCLTVVRKLKGLGIGITFEKEGIDTLDSTGEVILTILASIAQQESCSISQNIRLGIRYRFQQGIPIVNCSRFLGYDKKKGKLVINEAQAGIVRRIYRDFLDGFSLDMIAGDLRREGIRSGGGTTTWHTSSVRYILSNEKYAGDLLLQKTLIEDFLTHRLVRNKGQLPQYYVKDAHPPVVPHSAFERAAEELWLRANHGKKGGMHFGSRMALKNRVYCSCGERLRRLRRNEPVFVCDVCGKEVLEKEIKEQVMKAVKALDQHSVEIQQLLKKNQEGLNSPDHLTRAMSLRREWYLLNLLPVNNGIIFEAACTDETDFRARTGRRINAWIDDEIVRILEKVVVGQTVSFKGGLEIT